VVLARAACGRRGLCPGHVAGIVSLVSSQPQGPGVYKKRLADLRSLSHVTIEVETRKP